MKETFSGYYKDSDILNVLRTNKAIIVIDPLVLNSLFWFDDDIWRPILDLLRKREGSLWLPYSMADTYHRQIMPAIVSRIHSLVSIKNRIKQAADLMKTIPMKKDIEDEFKKISDEVSAKLTKEIAYVRQKGRKDSAIRGAIAELYKGKIGLPNNDPDPKSFKVKSYMNIDDTNAISENDLSQYESSVRTIIPQKDKNDIILHTLIKLGEDKNKDIVYIITKPSEYWSIFIGRTSFGPNPDHQTYFRKNSGHDLYCCTFSTFIDQLSYIEDVFLNESVKNNLRRLSYTSDVQNNDEDIFSIVR